MIIKIYMNMHNYIPFTLTVVERYDTTSIYIRLFEGHGSMLILSSVVSLVLFTL